MSDEDDGRFTMGPADEMQRRFGWTAENWQPPVLRADVVPGELRDLVPLAQRWGVTCDVTRHDVAAKASDADLAALTQALSGRHDAIDDWLYSSDKWNDEQAAFNAMVVLELEECDGPGSPGLLEWAIRFYRDQPSTERRERLASAYAQVLTWGPMPHLTDHLRVARELLGYDA
jgi:hypothetical protein